MKNLGNHKKSGIPAPLRDARSKNLKFVASFQFLEGTPKISPRAAHILLSAPQLGQNLYQFAVFNLLLNCFELDIFLRAERRKGYYLIHGLRTTQWYMRVRFVKLKVFKKLLFDAFST